MRLAAVVLHYPEREVPRKVLKAQREIHGLSWLDWQMWGFAWDDQMWANVRMGDSPDDLVQMYTPEDLERDARAKAREWIGSQGHDVAYFDLPGPARAALEYAMRLGPGRFQI